MDDERDRLDVRGREQAGAQGLAPAPADRTERLGDDRVRVAGVGAGLKHPAAPPQDRAQRAHLAALGVRRGQRARAAQVAVELVEEQLLGRHADEARVEGLAEQLLHLRLLRTRRADLLAGGPVQPHHGGAQVGVTDERRQVGAQRPALQRLDVRRGAVPPLAGLADALQRADDVLARDRLHPAEEVTGVDRVHVHRGERARPEQQGRHAVAQRLRDPRPLEHLDVVVGVDVHHARHHPPPGRLDDLGGRPRLQRGRGHGSDPAVADAEVAHGGLGARPVEPQAAADDGVVAHSTHLLIQEGS